MPKLDTAQIRERIEYFFEDVNTKESLLEKIQKADDLSTYWENQENDPDPYKKGFILHSNFSIKKYLEDVFIQEMFDAILAELQLLLDQDPPNPDIDKEELESFKAELEQHKNALKSTIENVQLPEIDLKTTLNMFNWIPGSDRVLFYSEVDLSGIINKMLEELLKVYDKVKFNIQLPPPSTKEEQESIDAQIKSYAEMIFKNCVTKGLDPTHVNLTINGQSIDPNVMFKNEMTQWAQESSDKFKEKLKEAKQIEEPFIQYSTRRGP